MKTFVAAMGLIGAMAVPSSVQAKDFGLTFKKEYSGVFVEAYVNLNTLDTLNTDGSYTIVGADGRIRFDSGDTPYANIIGVAPLKAAQGSYGDNRLYAHTQEQDRGQYKYFSFDGVNLLTDSDLMINVFSAKDIFGVPWYFDPVMDIYETSNLNKSTGSSYINWKVTVNAIALPSNPSVIQPTAPVPEPATWAMMLVGFGLIGAMSRYRRRSTTAAIA